VNRRDILHQIESCDRFQEIERTAHVVRIECDERRCKTNPAFLNSVTTLKKSSRVWRLSKSVARDRRSTRRR
jgi:hypothetical protein